MEKRQINEIIKLKIDIKIQRKYILTLLRRIKELENKFKFEDCINCDHRKIQIMELQEEKLRLENLIDSIREEKNCEICCNLIELQRSTKRSKNR